MHQSKLYFKNLDAIRFIAVLLVIIQHTLLNTFGRLSIDSTLIKRALFMTADGGSGVSIFFVLSGFLITYILMLEYEKTGTVSVKDFYIRRVLRIWPLFFAVITYTFFIYPGLKSLLGMNNPLPSNIFLHLTFLSNFDVINLLEHLRVSNAMSQDITWSVSIEEQFYVVWPLIFFFIPKRWWIEGILSVLIFSIAFRLLNEGRVVILHFHTFSNLMDLAMGGLYVWLIFNFSAIRSFFQQTGFWTHFLSYIILVSLLFFKEDIIFVKYGLTIFKIISTIIFGFIISCQALTLSNSKLQLSGWSFATKWGKYTYGMYMLHPIFLTLLLVAGRLLNVNAESGIAELIIAFLTLAFTMSFSWISYNYFEMRFLKLKSKFSKI